MIVSSLQETLQENATMTEEVFPAALSLFEANPLNVAYQKIHSVNYHTTLKSQHWWYFKFCNTSNCKTIYRLEKITFMTFMR